LELIKGVADEKLIESLLFRVVAEPLGLATQEKMDFGLIFATSTNKISSVTISHRRKNSKASGNK
jgi:hypothetical protein